MKENSSGLLTNSNTMASKWMATPRITTPRRTMILKRPEASLHTHPLHQTRTIINCTIPGLWTMLQTFMSAMMPIGADFIRPEKQHTRINCLLARHHMLLKHLEQSRLTSKLHKESERLIL